MPPYVNVDLEKSSNNAGIGGNKKAEFILADCDDIQTFPNRDGKGIVITDDFIMKPGKYMIRVYITQSTMKASVESTGDPDAKGIIHTVEGEHPGDAVALREFRNAWQNKNAIVFIRKCGSEQVNQYGDECAPMQLEFKGQDDKDKTNTAFTFKSVQNGPDVADYQGTFTFDTVRATFPADETNLQVQLGEGQYQLTNGTAAAAEIIALSGSIDGGVYTLLGSGGNHPSTIANATSAFLLKDGTTWTALAGATLTVRAFKSGPTEYKFFELSRT